MGGAAIQRQKAPRNMAPLGIHVVIPGQPAGAEPGIHFTAEYEARWIPGSRLAARPGMTAIS